MIMKANDSVSTTTLDGTLVPPSAINTTYTSTLAFNDNNHFSQNGAIVYSKSNDPTRSKSFDFVVNISNLFYSMSPVKIKVVFPERANTL